MDLLDDSSSDEDNRKKSKKIASSKKKSSSLKEDDSSISTNVLQINKKFASKFEREERFKELQRNKEFLEDNEDDSDEESEDDDAEFLTPAVDLQIVKTINSIRKKDPKIYDKSAAWFEKSKNGNNDNDNEEEDDDDDDNSNDSDSDNSKSGKSKKKTYKDVLREQLLSGGADINDDEMIKKPKSKHTSLIYDKEQEKLRRDFLKTVAENGDDSGDDDGSDDDDMLQVKSKDPREKAREEAELKKALEEMKKLNGGSDSSQTEKDDFLSDYITNQKWKSSFGNSNYRRGNADDDDEDDEDEVDTDEDEEELDKMEEFESKYNFRFEELQGSKDDGTSGSNSNSSSSGNIGGLRSVQVTGHARNVEGSARRVDDKRKLQREKRAERKEKERRQKETELRRLKNLKREELQDRLKKISHVGGIDGIDDINFDMSQLDEDWDPEKYEAMMAKHYNDDYYDRVDEDFDATADPDLNKEIIGDEVEYEDDEEQFEAVKSSRNKRRKDKKKKNKGVDVDANDDFDGQDYDEEEFLQDGNADTKTAGILMDELYKLDYEDIVAGIPCRFKYRQVEAEDFGLTTEDILTANDNELNQFVSLRRLSAFSGPAFPSSSDREHKIMKRRKRLRAAIRERLERNVVDTKNEDIVAGTNDEDVADVDVDKGNDEEGGKKKRRRRKKQSDIEDADKDKVEDPRPVPSFVLAASKKKSKIEDNKNDDDNDRKEKKKFKLKNKLSTDKKSGSKSKKDAVSETSRRLGLYS